jgi:SNF family Na+-dependent transporter
LPNISGAYTGIQFYIVPDFSRLNDIKVWEAAAIQV